MANFVTLNLGDYTKKISTNKFVLGKEYALVLGPDYTINSRLGYFRAFAFTNKNGQTDSPIMSNDNSVFSNTEFGASQAICKQMYDVIHKDKFSIVYFKFIPKNIFVKQPGVELLDPMNDVCIKNSIYNDDCIDPEIDATINVITDDINNIFE